MAVPGDGEFGDRYWAFHDAPDADVSVVGVVNEHASSGLEPLERLAPPAAAARTDVAVCACVFGVRFGSFPRARASAASGSLSQLRPRYSEPASRK